MTVAHLYLIATLCFSDYTLAKMDSFVRAEVKSRWHPVPSTWIASGRTAKRWITNLKRAAPGVRSESGDLLVTGLTRHDWHWYAREDTRQIWDSMDDKDDPAFTCVVAGGATAEHASIRKNLQDWANGWTCLSDRTWTCDFPSGKTRELGNWRDTLFANAGLGTGGKHWGLYLFELGTSGAAWLNSSDYAQYGAWLERNL